jgi:hypothetical protein
MGKRQILPNPTAEPAAAKTAPSLLPKFSRVLLLIFLPYLNEFANLVQAERNIKSQRAKVEKNLFFFTE